MWPQFLILSVSGVLFVALVGVVFVRRHDWRRYAWLILPWGCTVGSMCLAKVIEPRNVAPTIVVQVVALGIAIVMIRDRWRRTGDAIPPGLQTTSA